MLVVFLFAIGGVAFANSTLGISMFSSSMEAAPTRSVNQSAPNGYGKTSMVLYGQSSFAKETRLITFKTEILGLKRNEFNVNGHTFAQIQSSGIRTVELMGSQFLYRSGAWRSFVNVGYNTKGTQNNSNLQFALLNEEYVGGLMLLRTKKYQDPTLAPILTGLLQISQTPVYQVNIGYILGKNYNASEVVGTAILPVHKSINVKILGKIKQYTFEQGAQIFFQNEEKTMFGIILKSASNNSVEFSIYYDNIAKERGVSLGYFYFFNPNKNNSFNKAVNNIKEKYPQPKERKPGNKSIPSNSEVKDIVRETPEEMGY